jgi:SAM-dependent methyltransferase
VLELTCGTARNPPFYGDGVELTGIELSPGMLAIARQRAHELGHPADLQLGDVQALEYPDESFDTVTCTLGFCTIPDARAAAARRSGSCALAVSFCSWSSAQPGSDRPRPPEAVLEPLAVRLEADHLLREPLDYLPAAGFEIAEVRRSK